MKVGLSGRWVEEAGSMIRPVGDHLTKNQQTNASWKWEKCSHYSLLRTFHSLWIGVTIDIPSLNMGDSFTNFGFGVARHNLLGMPFVPLHPSPLTQLWLWTQKAITNINNYGLQSIMFCWFAYSHIITLITIPIQTTIYLDSLSSGQRIDII